jgi:hypothetical protein
MSVEAIALEAGVLRLADVRALAITADDELPVRLLMPDGGELRTTVAITTKPSGRGGHPALRCPRCGRPVGALRLHGHELQCRHCAPFLTAHQREWRTAWWCRLGGRQTDELLRLAVRPGRDNGLKKMAELARTLVRQDHQRLAVLMPNVRAVLDMAEGDE